MLGFEVNKAVVDMKAARSVLALRKAFEDIETMYLWLANHPSDGEAVDPLTDPEGAFRYTSDEAYALRLYFETMYTVSTANAETLRAGRMMTGLE